MLMLSTLAITIIIQGIVLLVIRSKWVVLRLNKHLDIHTTYTAAIYIKGDT